MVYQGIIVEMGKRKAIVMTRYFDFLLINREPQMVNGQLVKISEEAYTDNESKYPFELIDLRKTISKLQS